MSKVSGTRAVLLLRTKQSELMLVMAQIKKQEWLLTEERRSLRTTNLTDIMLNLSILYTQEVEIKAEIATLQEIIRVEKTLKELDENIKRAEQELLGTEVEWSTLQTVHEIKEEHLKITVI